MDGMNTRNTFAPLPAAEAGSILRRKRESLELSLADVVARTTVKSSQYLHNLEAGRINVSRSKHFPSIAQALELSEEQQALILGVRAIGNQSPVHSDRPVADVLNPLELVTPLLLGVRRVAAWHHEGEVLVLDQSLRSRTPEAGLTYLLLDEAQRRYTIARCVPNNVGGLMLFNEDAAWTPEQAGIVGRVLHRGKNL